MGTGCSIMDELITGAVAFRLPPQLCLSASDWPSLLVRIINET